MSGCGALTTRTFRRAALALAVLCAVGGALLIPPARDASAEPPAPTRPADPGKVDRNNPVPADAPKRRPRSDFLIDTDRAMFARIEDFKPVASEAENPDEYRAWTEVVTKAKQFTAAELEENATRALTALDLVKVQLPPDLNDLRKPRGSPYRCQLVRFEGKLVCARRLAAPKFFAENPESGIKEVYEARFVPLDESPLTPVSIVFLELPEALKAVREAPVEKWIDAGNWVVAAGYYFKTMGVPGEQDRPTNIPVLVGKSVTPLPGPPAPAGDDPTVIDPYVRIFDLIRDEAKMVRTAPTEATWPELAAEDRVILHAARFSAEELEKYARDDVKFADLFEPVRIDYKLKNVKMEGRLISLRHTRANNSLRAAGVSDLYEGWLVPATEPSGNPVCILFTEPLEGVEPNGRVNVWVTFAGFFFKKMRYESAEPDPKNPGRNLDKYAPLLIGKGPIVRPDPSGTRPLSWGLFSTAVIAGSILLALVAAGLVLWYRGGDRKAKEAMAAARGRNPFDAAAGPPAA